MAIFISYARDDATAASGLFRDLEQVHSPVWMDTRLSGGQVWWDAILDQIRSCDVFVVALSPDFIRSEACAAELRYALALRRPLLPVLVRNVAIELADPAIANTQYVDYRSATREAAFQLIGAVNRQPPAPPLPEALPPPPPAPLSYMSGFRELVDSPALTYSEQAHLFVDLRSYYEQGGERRAVALQLLHGMRQRGDIAYAIARDIDQLLASSAPRTPESPAPPRNPAYPGYQQPSGQTSGAPGPYQPPPAQVPRYTAPAHHGNVPPTRVPGPTNFAGTGQFGGPVPQPQPAPPRPGGSRSHPKATTILVLGIIGLVLCPITGIIAFAMSGPVLREIDARPGTYSDRGSVVAGRWIGLAGAVVGSLVWFFIIIGLANSSGY